MKITRILNYLFSEGFRRNYFSRKRCFYIDISRMVVHDHRTGIQRVTRAIAGELFKNKEIKVNLIYSSIDDLDYYQANSYMKRVFGIKRFGSDRRVKFRSGDILFFIDLNQEVAIAHREYLRLLRKKGVLIYHVVYDILPISHPNFFWQGLYDDIRKWVDVVRESDGALCISKTVSETLKEYLQKYGENGYFNVGWFHLGADLKNSFPTAGMPDDSEAVLTKISQMTSFLMVGAIEPRKGLLHVLDAFEDLWKNGKNVILVIVGRIAWGMDVFSDRIQNHTERGKRLFVLHDISDEYLEKIYDSSNCLIAASECEGFGLPLIEAAQHGLPIIARDIPVFNEVAGEHAYYFANNLSPSALSDSISSWLLLYETGGHPRSGSIPWLTWKQSTEQFLALISSGTKMDQIECRGVLAPCSINIHDSKKLKWDGFYNVNGMFHRTEKSVCSFSFQWEDPVENVLLRISYSSPEKQRIKMILNSIEIDDVTFYGDKVNMICRADSLRVGINELCFSFTSALLLFDIRDFEIIIIIWEPVLVGSIQNHFSKQMIWDGFSYPESEFRWTDGVFAYILFRHEGSVEDIRLRLLYSSFGEQRVALFLNSVQIYRGILSGDKVDLIIDLPSLQNGHNVLRFILPEAQSPGETDLRKLAIAVREFELVKKQP